VFFLAEGQESEALPELIPSTDSGPPEGIVISLKGNLAERGAGGGSRPRSGESEGRKLTILLKKKQVTVSVKKPSRVASCQKSLKGKSKSIVACETKRWSLMFLKKVNPDKIHFNLFQYKS
jgi:hypothetical protein